MAAINLPATHYGNLDPHFHHLDPRHCPPVSRDALNHHLAIPKIYLMHGGMHEIPSMHFSYFPMNLDLLYILPLWLGFDIGAKYIHFTFALLTATLIYRYLNKHLGQIYGAFGALLFLTTPIIIKLSVTAYVDLGLICFAWTCLYFLLCWIDTNFSINYLIFAGIACGLGLGTKYNGLILLFITASMVPLLYSRMRNRTLSPRDHRGRNINSIVGLQHSLIFLSTALVFFSPWMLRNWVWTHNPVYPLYNNVFNPQEAQKTLEPSSEQDQSASKNAFLIRKNEYNESFLQTITIPIRAFFQGKDDNPQFFDGKLNPSLLILPFFAFLRSHKSSLPASLAHRNILTGFSILFILFVLFESDFRIRYMAPAIPALVILAVFGIHALWQLVKDCSVPLRKGVRALALLSIISALVYNGLYILDQFSFIRPLEFISGQIDRDTYVSHYRWEHPVMVHANQVLPQNARVLCLSIGDRTYYLNRQAHLAEDFFNRISGGYTEEDLVKKMKRYGTTHIILNNEVYLGWAKQLPLYEQAVFDNVFKEHTRILYEANGVQLLQLL